MGEIGFFFFSNPFRKSRRVKSPRKRPTVNRCRGRTRVRRRRSERVISSENGKTPHCGTTVRFRSRYHTIVARRSNRWTALRVSRHSWDSRIRDEKESVPSSEMKTRRPVDGQRRDGTLFSIPYSIRFFGTESGGIAHNDLVYRWGRHVTPGFWQSISIRLPADKYCNRNTPARGVGFVHLMITSFTDYFSCAIDNSLF